MAITSLTEIIEIPDLKERSTDFLSGWFQAKVLRLPVEVPVVPRRRAPLFGDLRIRLRNLQLCSSFFCCAALVQARLEVHGGIRLFFWTRLCLCVIPVAAAVAAASDHGRREKNLSRISGGVLSMLWWRLGLIALLFVPLWRDREDAFFVIEPCNRMPCVLRFRAGECGPGARGPEGSRRRSLDSDDELSGGVNASAALAQTRSARFKTFDAQITGAKHWDRRSRSGGCPAHDGLAKEAQSALELTSPADGTVLTEIPHCC